MSTSFFRRMTQACRIKSPRDSLWMDFMTTFGISEEELDVLRLQLCSAPKLFAVHGASLLHRH
jgi:hypothetical protein